MRGNGPALTSLADSSDRRLGSWKEIATYLGRGVRSVQRWEREEGLPVHRLSHLKRGSVYAYKSELDEWWQNRRSSLATQELELPEEVERNASRTGFRAVLSQKSAILVGTVILGALAVYFTIPHTKNGSLEM